MIVVSVVVVVVVMSISSSQQSALHAVFLVHVKLTNDGRCDGGQGECGHKLHLLVEFR